MTDQSGPVQNTGLAGIDDIQVLRNNCVKFIYRRLRLNVRPGILIYRQENLRLEILRSDVKIAAKEYKPLEKKIIATVN